jgi:hypothetical protein
VQHDGAKERCPVLEVVVELTLAGAGTREDVVDARLGDASFADQLRGGGDDPLARHPPAGGRRGIIHWAAPFRSDYGLFQSKQGGT